MTLAERFAHLRHRSRSGSAALEFAFIAPVFFVLMMGTLESGVIFFAQNNLTEAVNEAGREIRTGSAQSSDHTKNADGTPTQYATEADWFRQQICNQAGMLLPNCATTLQIDVESTSSFGNLAFNSPLLADGTLNPAASGYNPGTACSVVLVRAYYPWAVATPGLTWFMVNMKIASAGSGGSPSYKGAHLVTAAMAFRNEPFVSGGGGC